MSFEGAMPMVEMLLGAVIGAVVSVALAEVYQRRASKEFDKRMQELDSLFDDLRYLVVSAGEKADAAKDQAYKAWLQSVGNSPEHPDFPFK
jgi:t-SNARE complex subunit (syntaxin)